MPLAQGNFGGEEAIVKMYEPRFPEAKQHFDREHLVYMHLQGKQGTLLPRLLKCSIFAHTGAMFLALSNEGEHIGGGDIAPAVRSAMCACVRALHAEGVLHGDIRRENFVLRGEKVTVIDFGRAKVVGVGTHFQAAMEEEEEQVAAL